MPPFFDRRDRWGNGVALWVLAGAMFVLPPALWNLARLELHNEPADWLAGDEQQARQFTWLGEQFPQREEILLTWDGSQVTDPRLADLARRLEGVPGADGVPRGGLKQVAHAQSPLQLADQMVKNGVPRAEALHRLEGVLAGPGPLCLRLTTVGQEHRERVESLLRDQARKQLGLEITLAAPLEILAATEEEASEDGSGDEAATEEPIEDFSALIHDFQVTWSGLHGDNGQIARFEEMALGLKMAVAGVADGEPVVEAVFIRPGAPAGILITLSEAGVADRAGTILEIQKRAVAAGIDPDQLRLGGLPVTFSAFNQEAAHSVWNGTAPLPQRSILLLAGVLLAAFSFWVLQNVRLAVLLLGATALTTILSVALMPLGGAAHPLLAILPGLVLVVTLAAGICVAHFWKAAAERDPHTAVAEAAAAACRPWAWAGIVLAILFVCLLTTGLASLSQFGMSAAMGVLLALSGALLVLPAMMQLWPVAAPVPVAASESGWRRWSTMVSRHPFLTIGGCLLMILGCLYGLKWHHTETRVIEQLAPASRARQDAEFLEDQLAGSLPIETIIRFSAESQEKQSFTERMEVVRLVQAKLRAESKITGTLSLVDFYPVNAPSDPEASLVARRMAAAKSKGVEEAVKSAAGVVDFLITPDSSGAYHRAGDELWRIRTIGRLEGSGNQAALMGRIEEICRSELRYFPGAGHIVTGHVPVLLAAQEELLHSLMICGILGSVVLVVTLSILTRNLLSGLLAAFPVVSAVVAGLGWQGWHGQAIDLSTALTSSIAFALTLGCLLPVLVIFQSRLASGMKREEALAETLNCCGPLVGQTCRIVVVGAAVLSWSSFMPLSQGGGILCFACGAAAINSLMLLPALLAGPLGYLLERSLPKAAQPPATTPVPQPLHQPVPHATKSPTSVLAQVGATTTSAAVSAPPAVSGAPEPHVTERPDGVKRRVDRGNGRPKTRH